MRSIFSAARHCRKYIFFDHFELFGDLVYDREVIIAYEVENSVHNGDLPRRSRSGLRSQRYLTSA
jgi:hypothetical protein